MEQVVKEETAVVEVTAEKLAPGEIVRTREDGAEERIITTVDENGKIFQKVITTFPQTEIEEEVITEEITEGESVTVTTTTTVTTNVTQSEIIGVPKVAAPTTVTTATSANPTPALELTKKPEPGKELVEYDEATKTTTVTRRIEKGYEQTITTVLEDGTKRTQTRTFMDPEEEVVAEEEEIIAGETKVIKKETNKTTELKKVSADQKTTQETTQTTVDTTKKEIVEEEFVVTDAMKQLKTGEVITKVDEATKTTTVIKRIENGYERTITRVFEDGTSKTTTKTIFDVVEVKEEDNNKTTTVDEANKKVDQADEFVITEEMKKLKTGEEIVKKCKKTNTTTVIKRIENGYERTVTVINNDGSMRSQTKIIYDPVEVVDVEETKQIQPIIPASPAEAPVVTKTTETTVDSNKVATQTVESSTTTTNVQQQTPVPTPAEDEALKKLLEEITQIQTQEIVITEAMTKLKVNEEIVEVIERIKTTIVIKRIENGYERVTTTIMPDGTRRTQKKTTFDPVPVDPPKAPEAPKPVEAPKPAKPAEVPKPVEAPKPVETPKPAEVPKAAEAPKAPESQPSSPPQPTKVPEQQVAKVPETKTVDTQSTQVQETQQSSKKVSTQETVQQQSIQETSTTKQTTKQQVQEQKVERTVETYETDEEFVPTEAMKNLKVGEEIVEVDEVTKTTTVTRRTEDGYIQTITTVLGDGTKKTWAKTFYDEEEIIEETEEVEETEETNKSVKKKKKETAVKKTKDTTTGGLPDANKILAVCPTKQEVSIIDDPNIARKRVVRHGEEEIEVEEEEEDLADPTQKTKRAAKETRQAKIALEESQKTEGATKTHTQTATADAVEKKSEVLTSNVGGINADVRTTSEASQSTKNTTSTSVTPAQGPGQGTVTVTTMRTEKTTSRKQSSSAIATGNLEALAAQMPPQAIAGPQAPPRKKDGKKGGKGK